MLIIRFPGLKPWAKENILTQGFNPGNQKRTASGLKPEAVLYY
jgi:hypothetical protein